MNQLKWLSYTTRSVKKRLLGDAMKSNKIATTKRRRLQNETVVYEEHIEVVNVGEGQEDIDADVCIATKNRRKKIQVSRRTSSFQAKPKFISLKKHIAVKRKVFEGPSPSKENLSEEESGSGPKKRKVQKEA